MYSTQLTYHRIKYIMRLKDITLNKMIADTGINRTVISNSLRNKSGMNAANLYLIASYLGVSADYLLGLSNDLNNDILSEIQNQLITL